MTIARPKRQETEIVQGPQRVPVSQLDERGAVPHTRVVLPPLATRYPGLIHTRRRSLLTEEPVTDE